MKVYWKIMEIEEDIRIIGKVGMLEYLKKEKLRMIELGEERIVMSEGREILREGKSEDWEYIIVKGKIKMFNEGDEGRVKIRNVGKGEILGEMEIIEKKNSIKGEVEDVEKEVIRIRR